MILVTQLSFLAQSNKMWDRYNPTNSSTYLKDIYTASTIKKGKANFFSLFYWPSITSNKALHLHKKQHSKWRRSYGRSKQQLIITTLSEFVLLGYQFHYHNYFSLTSLKLLFLTSLNWQCFYILWFSIYNELVCTPVLYK